MKISSLKMSRNFIACFLIATVVATTFSSCKKNDPLPNTPVSAYSSQVLDKWITMQLRLMRNSTGIPNQAFSRHFAYSGIAALESLAPALQGQLSQYRKWNGLTGLPVAAHSPHSYYYPANINGAMAGINKALFPNASAADKAAIDSLEAALNESFLSTQPASRITKSTEFGRAVAAAVFTWADNDGYKNANNPYTPPTGPGLWKATSPGGLPATPYWGNNRTVVAGSINNTQPGPPPAYSEVPGSSFFQMAKQVYDASQTLTADQMAMAIYWRDVPGVSSPGHWLSIMQQAIQQKSTRLDKAALAYALTGAAMNDALISCWKAKYTYNLVRPVTYIREVMGHTTWNTYIGTPSHPEYPSAHSSLSGAAAEVLDNIIGNINSLTDHTYDYMGLAPRTYTSFSAIANEAGISRLYGGIHFQPAINAGLEQGREVADNILPGKNH